MDIYSNKSFINGYLGYSHKQQKVSYIGTLVIGVGNKKKSIIFLY